MNQRLGWKRQLQPAVHTFCTSDPEWLEQEAEYERERTSLEAHLQQAAKKLEQLELETPAPAKSATRSIHDGLSAPQNHDCAD